MRVKTPDGYVYNLDDCELLEDECSQQELAKEMFEKHGILVAELKGGENDGRKE